MIDGVDAGGSPSAMMLSPAERAAERMGKTLSQCPPCAKANAADYWRRFARALSTYDHMTDEHVLIAKLVGPYVSELQTQRCSDELRLLDIGPGYGHLARKIPVAFQHRVAVEPNPRLRAAVRPMYDRVYGYKWETAASRISSFFEVIVASQLLYYLPPELRPDCIHAMIDRLQVGGILVLVLDTFEGAFGEFLVDWSGILGITEHVVPVSFVRDVLAKRRDVEIQEIGFTAMLQASSLPRFSRGISVYFDVNTATSDHLRPDYRQELERFNHGTDYVAQNNEMLWIVRKKGT